MAQLVEHYTRDQRIGHSSFYQVLYIICSILYCVIRTTNFVIHVYLLVLLVKILVVYTVKPVLSGHSKIDKTKILMKNRSLMKVESVAECSLGAFCNTFDLH